MKYWSSWFRGMLAGIMLFAGLGFLTTAAHAQGTAPGTSIGNTATLAYSVGGVAQTAIPANSPTFLVDRLVRVLVTESSNTPTNVVPGALAQVTQFTVQNTGNLAQAYTLAAAELIAGQVIPYGAPTGNKTDNANAVASSCSAFVESGVTLGYQAAQDTAVAITTLAPGSSQTVYVVCGIPLGLANNDIIGVSLTATTAETAGCAATGVGCTATVASATAGADNAAAVDIVFGDAAGSEAADTARDGKHSARDAYQIAAAALTVTKNFSLLCDPVNLTTNPRSIPGALVRYTITVSNAVGAASATLGDITDTLNANLAFDNNLSTGAGATCTTTPEFAVNRGFKLTCGAIAPTVNSRACVATPVSYTVAVGDDAAEVSGQAVTAKMGTALIAEGAYALGELKGGETATITFNATVR